MRKNAGNWHVLWYTKATVSGRFPLEPMISGRPGSQPSQPLSAAQPLTFINQRTLPVSTRTLSIVNSSPVLWPVADAEKYGIDMNLPGDFVGFYQPI